ncbi:S-layer homology domain-containing protein, partial [Tepidibacter formicigenes]
MKNTKKVLSVALAGALAFGSMGAAFAAAPQMNEDTDKKVVEAVERLYSFGVVNGFEDGKYHEEYKVTREQFAKLLVEALGLGSAAQAANGST